MVETIIIFALIILLLLIIIIQINNDYSKMEKKLFETQAKLFAAQRLLEIQKREKPFKSSKEVLDAVHYAMKKSHPDNGGTQEEFVKFRKLYESMKGA